MTLVEAFQSIEDAVTALSLRDRWGNPIEGIEGTGIVAKFSGSDWDENQDRLEAGIISADEFHGVALGLICEFEKHLFRRKIERKIQDLRLDQIELDLLSEPAETGNQS